MLEKQQGDQRGCKSRSEAEVEGDEVRKVGRGQITLTLGAMVSTLGILFSAVEAIREF